MFTKKQLPWLLAVCFAFAMFMGTGPGIYFANEAKTWLGYPRLYIWAVFWCSVETTIILIAYIFVWHAPNEQGRRS
jgi:hypothetical protein